MTTEAFSQNISRSFRISSWQQNLLSNCQIPWPTTLGWASFIVCSPYTSILHYCMHDYMTFYTNASCTINIFPWYKLKQTSSSWVRNMLLFVLQIVNTPLLASQCRLELKDCLLTAHFSIFTIFSGQKLVLIDSWDHMKLYLWSLAVLVIWLGVKGEVTHLKESLCFMYSFR